MFKPFTIICLCYLLLIFGCSEDDSNPGEPADPSQPYDVVLPCRVITGGVLPIVLVDPHANPRVSSFEKVQIIFSSMTFQNDQISVKRGAGSVTNRVSGTETFDIELRSGFFGEFFSATVEIISNPGIRELSGVLSGDDLVWDSTSVIHLVGDATVPAGEDLTVQPGTIVEAGHLVNLFVEGGISSTGTPSAPVIFSSINPEEPWGEIHHSGASNYYVYTFLTCGGGDTSRTVGHSNSQPLLAGEGCSIVLQHTYIIDCPGKGLGMSYADVSMQNCLISRCDMGAEFSRSSMIIDECYFIDMPYDDDVEVDDDNDALYLYDVGGDPSLIINSVFVTGKDDGIDHNGADVRIVSCIIEDYDNEGIATSNAHRAEIFNTLVLNCEQGIEAGYGSPEVLVDHCLVIANQTGFRFGDWYTNGCTGTLEIWVCSIGGRRISRGVRLCALTVW